jgi:hypothetical protein
VTALPPGFDWWPPDLEVRWLGTAASALYIVLEQEPFDYDDGFTQYVARLLPPTLEPHGLLDDDVDENGEPVVTELLAARHPLVVPIHALELRHVQDELRRAVEGHPGLAEDDLAGLGAWGAFRGGGSFPSAESLSSLPIHEAGSDGYYDECLRERRLDSRGLNIEYAAVQGIERQSTDRVRLTLKGPTAAGRAVDVRAHLQANERFYLVLEAATPPPAEVGPGKLQIVCAIPGAVDALAWDEHKAVARLLIDALEDGRQERRFRPLSLALDVARDRRPPGLSAEASLEKALALLAARPDLTKTMVTAEPLGAPAVGTPPVGAPTVILCRGCRHVVPADHRYCGFCGAALV